MVGAGLALTLQTGHRYAIEARADSGPLPASFQGATVERIQADMNAAGIAVNIVSVKYAPDGSALYVEEDHCGSATTVVSPTTANGVTTTYTDMGPASTCAATGMSKGEKVAIGVGVAAVIAVGLWWIL